MQADPDSFRIGYLQGNLDARLAIQTVLRRKSTNDEIAAALFDVFKLMETSTQEMYKTQAPKLFVHEQETQIKK